MPSKVRRVVTGHDANGRAVVTFDETVDVPEVRPGIAGRVFWVTEGFPVDNTGGEDTSSRQVATTLANGSIFRIVEFAPGNSPRRHRTDSIDYAIVLYGEIDMELEGPQDAIHLRAGDVLVQRGTIHNWINKGTVPCGIAFILIDAKPVEVGGKVLHAEG